MSQHYGSRDAALVIFQVPLWHRSVAWARFRDNSTHSQATPVIHLALFTDSSKLSGGAYFPACPNSPKEWQSLGGLSLINNAKSESVQQRDVTFSLNV